MSKSIVAALLGAGLLAIGCQPNTSNPPPASRPALSPNAGLESGQPAEQDQPGEGAIAPNADPGMDPHRDKTPAEELPSGDKSSQAAPNDGDAEPPAP